jgi:hypothetical protein
VIGILLSIYKILPENSILSMDSEQFILIVIYGPPRELDTFSTHGVLDLSVIDLVLSGSTT